MKKILALTLAAVMTAGMTTVAFAQAPEGVYNATAQQTAQQLLDAGAREIQTPALSSDVYVINSDGEVYEDVDGIEKFDVLEGGDEIAIPVEVYTYYELNDRFWYAYGSDNWNGAPAYYTLGGDYDEDLTVWTDWDENEADVDTRFVRYRDTEDGEVTRIMSVIITVPENNSDRIEDLVGTVKVGENRSTARNSNSPVEIDVSFAPDGTDEFYKYNFDGSEVLEAGRTGIVDFDTEAGEIDIEFGDEAMFTVNVNGQSRLNLAWTTRHDPEVAAMDESVNMDFITFEGNPSFNRTGTMYIYAADDTFLYQVVDGELEKVDAKYNEDYEAWEFRTRTLDTYVIADGEIDLEAITDNTDDNSSTTEDGNKANPDTGR